jgi:hypothetical protein
MSMTDDDRAQKVAKLLAMAEDPGCTEAERAAFSAKAEELLVRWQLDAWAVRNIGKESNEVRYEDKAIILRNPFMMGRRYILAAVAEGNGVAVSLTRYGYNKTSFLGATLCGQSRDIERVKVIYTSLEAEALLLAKRVQRPRNVNANKFIANFLIGFAVGSKRRFLETKRIATHAAVNANLPVPVDELETAVKWAHQQLGWKERYSSHRLTDTAAYRAGQEASAFADVGAARLRGQAALGMGS